MGGIVGLPRLGQAHNNAPSGRAAAALITRRQQADDPFKGSPVSDIAVGTSLGAGSEFTYAAKNPPPPPPPPPTKKAEQDG